MKYMVCLAATLVFSSFSALSTDVNKPNSQEGNYDVKKGVERVQYEWTRLNDKDKDLLKDSSMHEKNADPKVKKELEAYKEKTDELYNNLSAQSKKFISEKSKLYKKLSNKGKKFTDEIYFLVKKGVKTFQIPGIDDLMPLSGIKSDNSNPTTPVINGKQIDKKQ